MRCLFRFVNNAGFSFLGQNWTIIGYTLPGASGTAAANNTNPSVTSTTSSTGFINGGVLDVASSLSSLTTIYVGQNLTAGPYTVQLTDIGQPNSNGISPAAINLYKNGALTNVTSVLPPKTASFNISGVKVYVKVNQTFAGLYALTPGTWYPTMVQFWPRNENPALLTPALVLTAIGLLKVI